MRRIVVSGPILVAIGLGIMAAFLTEHAGAGAMVAWVIGLLFAGVGIGIAWPHLAVGAMTSVTDPGEGARASAAINTVQLIANAFGAALAGVLVNIGEPSTLRSAQLLLFTFAAVSIIGIAVAARALPRTPDKIGSPEIVHDAR
ncbi:hypothetical protein RQCS_52660 [Rhodococcus qingshengii]|nr:hypothetical protein RQCS_52660 [Rhodococcus qingshengii]